MSIIKKTSYILFLVVIVASFSFTPVLGQTSDESELFNQANEYFEEGLYKEAITIYDEILEQIPNNIFTLKMKGTAQSNLGYHEESLKQFFTVLQYNPDDVISLTGMGIGFGNLGEYHEAKIYFDMALEKKPNSIVINNYKEFIDKIISVQCTLNDSRHFTANPIKWHQKCEYFLGLVRTTVSNHPPCRPNKLHYSRAW